MTEYKNSAWAYWNLKSFDECNKPYSVVEHPFYTDSKILGERNRSDEPYKFINHLVYSEEGEVSDAIILRVFWYLKSDQFFEVDTNYNNYHGGWITDELAALLSLKFGIRVKAGQLSRIYKADYDTDFGSPRSVGRSKPYLNMPILGPVLPSVVRTVNITDFNMRALIFGLDEEQFVALVRSAKMYQNALWVAESEPELAWLLLVSSLETAANCWMKLSTSNLKRLETSKNKLFTMLSEKLDQESLSFVADEIAPTLGATNKFIKFCIHYFPQPPEERPPEWAQVEWTEKNFKKILNKVYSYRSKALHGGIPFPEPMCRPAEIVRECGSVMEKGCIGLASHSLGGSWKSEDLPISLDTFCCFSRNVLINWWEDLIRRGIE